MSGDILFLAHRLPFPPDRGDKIRSHHVLRHLATLAPVHVACFADDARDMAHEGELVALAATHCLVRRTKPLPMAGLEALVRGEPVSLAAFRDARIAHFVAETLAGGRVDTIYVFSGQMGRYVPDDFAGRVIADLVDVDSAKFEAYAETGRWPRRWIDAREGRLLRAEEQRIAERAGHTLFISEAERALFLSRLVACRPVNTASLANGIDTDWFDPAMIRPGPTLVTGAGPHLVFTGQMDYAPNVAAAQRLAGRLMPLVLAHHPAARCHIVGRRPAEAVRVLHGCNGSVVWGEVPDVRPFLARADLVLVPLDIARGVQNKVLEAMAMARPLVLTAQAATGIGGIDGRHFAVGDGDDALVARALALLDRREEAEAMGRAARRFVLDHCSWKAALAPLSGMLGEAAGSKGTARVAA